MTAMTPEDLVQKVLLFDDLLFDLDETIYAVRDYDKAAFSSVCDELAAFGAIDKTDALKWLYEHKEKKGRHYRALFDDFLGHLGMPLDLKSLCVSVYQKEGSQGLSPERSLVPALQELSDKYQKRIFIVTNGYKERQLAKIKALQLDSLITDIYIADPTDKVTKLKPDTAGYFNLDKLYNLTNPVMVGDDPEIDGKFAENVKIPFIEFTYSR